MMHRRSTWIPPDKCPELMRYRITEPASNGCPHAARPASAVYTSVCTHKGTKSVEAHILHCQLHNVPLLRHRHAPHAIMIRTCPTHHASLHLPSAPPTPMSSSRPFRIMLRAIRSWNPVLLFASCRVLRVSSLPGNSSQLQPSPPSPASLSTRAMCAWCPFLEQGTPLRRLHRLASHTLQSARLVLFMLK